MDRDLPDPYPGMTVVEVDLEDLVPAEYNPRAITAAERRQIRDSIERFGMVEPLVVNGHPDRWNVVIGGHQRLKVLEDMGWMGVPVVYVVIGDIVRERELNIRLNKNQGHWDPDLLRGFSAEELSGVGFTEKELAELFPADDPEDVPADVPFGEEMLEEQQYVVLTFDNRLDWLRLQSFYPLPSVRSFKSKAGGVWQQQGIGRVVHGTAFLDAIADDDVSALAGRVAEGLARLDGILDGGNGIERADLVEIRRVLGGADA